MTWVWQQSLPLCVQPGQLTFGFIESQQLFGNGDANVCVKAANAMISKKVVSREIICF